MKNELKLNYSGNLAEATNARISDKSTSRLYNKYLKPNQTKSSHKKIQASVVMPRSITSRNVIIENANRLTQRCGNQKETEKRVKFRKKKNETTPNNITRNEERPVPINRYYESMEHTLTPRHLLHIK